MPTISTLTVDVEARTSNFSRGLKIAVAGLAALAAGAAYAFKQFEDAEKISRQTDAVLTSTGHAANVTAEEIEGLAASISELSGIDDEAIQAGENLLLTFTNIRNEAGKGNDIFDQATMAITDMSVAMGTDMKSAAIQVGKALQDPILGMTALRRVGVSFTAAQTEMVNKWVEQGQVLRAQKFILAELTKEFGGSAEAQKTASAAAGVALGNLAETIGSVLAPAFEWLAESLNNLVQFMQANVGPAFDTVSGWFQTVWEKVGPLATAIGTQLVEAFNQTIDALGPLWNKLQELWDALEPVRAILVPILKLLASLQLAFLWLVAEAIPPLLQALGWVVDKLAVLSDAFGAVVTFVRENFVEPIIGAVVRVWDKIKEIAAWIGDRFVAAWQAIEGPVTAVLDAITNAAQWLIDKLRVVIDTLNEIITLGGAATQTYNSGPVGSQGNPSTTTGGFHGPVERIIGAGRVAAVNVTVNGWVGNDQQIAERVRAELLKMQRWNMASTGIKE